MRARLAIVNSAITIELREVVLRDKPSQLLAISPKATVPVLELITGEILEESLDIIYWALSINDPDHWVIPDLMNDIKQLIHCNDGEFKYYLDRYKYADRYPENNELFYRGKAESFVSELEKRLSQHTFLCSNQCSLADMAIFPFIRQFANVDIHWFQSSKYQHLNQWLNNHLQSELFTSIMQKYPAWQAGDKPLFFTP